MCEIQRAERDRCIVHRNCFVNNFRNIVSNYKTDIN